MEEIIRFNRQFVEKKEYEPFTTSKFPNKKLVIVTCMDTRLTELLPKALNLKNGDAKIIKNAGAVISHPFGSIMRSIILAVYELTADKVCVIGHYGCGMANPNKEQIIEKMKQRGVKQETLDTVEYAGYSLYNWLEGFKNVEEQVKDSVRIIRNHPLMPEDVPVYGCVIDPETGRLDVVDDCDQPIGEEIK